MEIIVNQAKIKSCTIDDTGEVRLPKFFDDDLNIDLSKNILKLIVRYCLNSNNFILPMTNFNVIISDSDIKFNSKTIEAIINLIDNDYISIPTI